MEDASVQLRMDVYPGVDVSIRISKCSCDEACSAREAEILEVLEDQEMQELNLSFKLHVAGEYRICYNKHTAAMLQTIDRTCHFKNTPNPCDALICQLDPQGEECNQCEIRRKNAGLVYFGDSAQRDG